MKIIDKWSKIILIVMLVIAPILMLTYRFIWNSPDSVVSYDEAVYFGQIVIGMFSFNMIFLWLLVVIRLVIERLSKNVRD